HLFANPEAKADKKLEGQSGEIDTTKESLFTQTQHLFAGEENPVNQNLGTQSNMLEVPVKGNNNNFDVPIVISVNTNNPDYSNVAPMEVDDEETKTNQGNLKNFLSNTADAVRKSVEENPPTKKTDGFKEFPPIPSVTDNFGLREGEHYEPPRLVLQNKEAYIHSLDSKLKDYDSAIYFYKEALQNSNLSKSSKWDYSNSLDKCEKEREEIRKELFELGRYKEKPWDVNDKIASFVGELKVDYRFYQGNNKNFTEYVVNRLDKYFLEDDFFSALGKLDNCEEEFLKLWNSSDGQKKIKEALNLGNRKWNFLKGNLNHSFRDQKKAQRRFETCEKFAEKCKKSLEEKATKVKINEIESNLNKEKAAFQKTLKKDQVSKDDLQSKNINKEKSGIENSVKLLSEELRKTSFNKQSFMKNWNISLDRARNGELNLNELESFQNLVTWAKNQCRLFDKNEHLEFRNIESEVRKMLTSSIVAKVDSDGVDSLTEQQKIRYGFWEKYQNELKQKNTEKLANTNTHDSSEKKGERKNSAVPDKAEKKDVGDIRAERLKNAMEAIKTKVDSEGIGSLSEPQKRLYNTWVQKQEFSQTKEENKEVLQNKKSEEKQGQESSAEQTKESLDEIELQAFFNDLLKDLKKSGDMNKEIEKDDYFWNEIYEEFKLNIKKVFEPTGKIAKDVAIDLFLKTLWSLPMEFLDDSAKYASPIDPLQEQKSHWYKEREASLEEAGRGTRKTRFDVNTISRFRPKNGSPEDNLRGTRFDGSFYNGTEMQHGIKRHNFVSNIKSDKYRRI
ncbi:MAG: hypothetical protein ABIA74_03260, partial [bacterium]